MLAAVLTDQEDAFGALLRDGLDGRTGPRPLLERDDGGVGPALGAETFLAGPDAWPDPERRAFAYVRGRVLDIGCGAGRHSLAAQAQGLQVVAIDISPGAVEVSRRRGVRDVRLLPLAELDDRLGAFDTVLLLCGNAGLAGGGAETAALLWTLHRLTGDDGRIVLDSVDSDPGDNAADRAYAERNLASGRMPGLVTIRLRYGERVTPWFELLCLAPAELEALAAEVGWRIAQLEAGDPGEYYAVLEKA